MIIAALLGWDRSDHGKRDVADLLDAWEEVGGSCPTYGLTTLACGPFKEVVARLHDR